MSASRGTRKKAGDMGFVLFKDLFQAYEEEAAERTDLACAAGWWLRKNCALP
jgi:hypothetical protein